MNAATVAQWLRTAEEAAQKAAKIQMTHYGKLKASEISLKSKNDFVTKIDRQCEKVIISTIRRRFPSHGFLGEEGGAIAGNGIVWVIDPLDGTANYIHQFPMFSISIAVLKDGVLHAGVIYDALHAEMFTAAKGRGAYLNGRRIHCSRTRRLADGLIATGIPFRARNRFDEYLRSFSRISRGSAGIRRGGSAALDLAYVACGRLDGFWEINLSPWDIAAGALLITEAGGKISDVWGGSTYLQNGDVLGSNGRIQKELLAVTASAFSRYPKKALL